MLTWWCSTVFVNTRSWSRSRRRRNCLVKASRVSLRILEWEKVCDSVASFAGTSLGREATKAHLLYLHQTTYPYHQSLNLLAETNAAFQILNYPSFSFHFSHLHLPLVKSAIGHARGGLPMHGSEALAVLVLLQFAETLQFQLKAAIKEDADWYKRFMPISQVIMDWVINRSLIKLFHQTIDEDGSVKDSASPDLKRARNQVQMIERKLYQLMDSLIRNEMKETSSLEVCNTNGRWCLKFGADQVSSVTGLLLSSVSGIGSIVEPLSTIPLNDELQQAMALVAKYETEVLLKLAKQMQMDLVDIQYLLDSIIQLDMINARAAYSLSFGGTYPDLYLPEEKDGSVSPTLSDWKLYLPKVYHPLLLQQHRHNLHNARKDVSNAIAETRRRKLQGENLTQTDQIDANILFLQKQVTTLEKAHPVPVNVFISEKTRVLIITGPNTGGKTICLKTIALAAIMAKSGLYVLSSEPVRIPWFDFIFADIGDEQSLSQSLSTFSGHLKQISDIKEHSTSRSLVILDEVGAGTNPLEGAALGMSILESFAETGAFLTIATTHHGELKTLKYSNDTIENACMEFDDENLKPTYKILWGIPGRSNAISIAQRLGLPSVVLENARKLYGAASTEINEVIIDMEKSKQDFQEHIRKAEEYIQISRDVHENLLSVGRKMTEHGKDERYRQVQEIREVAALGRSMIHKKARECRLNTSVVAQASYNNQKQKQYIRADDSEKCAAYIGAKRKSSGSVVPKCGDVVSIRWLGKKGRVIKVDESKEEIIVEAGNMKLKLKLTDVTTTT